MRDSKKAKLALDFLLPLSSRWGRLLLAGVALSALTSAGWSRFVRAPQTERLVREHRHLFHMEQNVTAVADAELENRITALHAQAKEAEARLFHNAQAASQRVASFEAILSGKGWSMERLLPEPSALDANDTLAFERYRIDFQAPKIAPASGSTDGFSQLDRLLRELRDEDRSLEIERLSIASNGQSVREATITLVAPYLNEPR